jgi:DNA-binding LytR/AlgR family response regulator
MIRCMIVDDDELSRVLLQRFVRQHGGLELVASCGSAVEAARVLRDDQPQLVYLDVEMPEMSGLDLIRSVESRPEVILVTGTESYALEAFELEVTDYLVKPVSYAHFLRATTRALRRLDRPAAAAGDHLFLRFEGRLTKVDLDDVVRVEAERDSVLFHTAKQVYRVTATMKAIEETLPDADFVRVHRSHIVRIDRIIDIEEGNLVVGRDVIPVSASYRPGLLGRLRTL